MFDLIHFQVPVVYFQNVIVHLEHGAEDLTHKPNVEPVEMLSFESGETADFVCERDSRKKPRRNVKTQTSEITAPNKVIQLSTACTVMDLHYFLYPHVFFLVVFYIMGF